MVIVEFPDMERLQSWYASAEYAEALAVRKSALTRRLLFVDGVSSADPTPDRPAQPERVDRSQPFRGSLIEGHGLSRT